MAPFIPGCFCDRKGDTARFKGLIASSRILDLSKKGTAAVVVVFLGIGEGKYIEVLLKGKVPNLATKIGVSGEGKIGQHEYDSIECSSFSCF